MYNKKEKEKFLQYFENSGDLKTINKLMQVFAKTESIEQYLDKDIGLFDTQEMKVVLKGFGYTSVGAVKNMHTLLKKYFKWRHEKYNNPVIRLSAEEYEDCVKIKKANLLSVTEMESIIQRSDPSLKFVIQALKEGMRGSYLSEILLAKMSNINENKIAIYEYDVSAIKYTKANRDIVIYPQYTRTIQVSDKFVQYAKMSAAMDVTRLKNGRINGILNGNDTIIRYQIKGDCKSGNFSKQATVGVLISRCSSLEQKMIKNTGISISMLYESALCHAICNKAQKENIDVASLFLPENVQKNEDILSRFNITDDELKNICKKYLL